MKSILIEFLGKNGAGVSMTYEIAKSFANKGFDVYVLLSSKVLNRKQWEDIKIANMHMKFIDTGNKRTILQKTVGFLFTKNKILREEKSIQFDFALRTFPHPWLELIEKELGIRKVFFILHDPLPHTGTQWYRKKIAKRSVDTATDIIVMSKKFISVVHDHYGIRRENIHYMRLGFLSATDVNNQSVDIDLTQFNDSIVNFVFFGRIDKYKGLHILSEAYNNIKEKSNVHLIVAGSGDFFFFFLEYKELHNCLVINRYINDLELREILSLKNVVLILPYTDATQSGVIPLAVEYNCPVIASDSGALKEQLDEGKNGLFFEPGNPLELTALLERMINDSSLYNEEREKMKQFQKKFLWDNIISEFMEGLH